ALNFVEEPSGDSGGGAPADSTKETSDEETSGDEDDKGSGDEDEDSDKGGGFKPITTQDELDRVIGPRLQRERAKFADYGDLKQKVADQEATISELREKLGEQEMKDKRKSIAEKAGVPESVLRGDTEEELQAHAEELKAAFNKTEEDEQADVRRKARSPHTGTGAERPAAPSQAQGPEKLAPTSTRTSERTRTDGFLQFRRVHPGRPPVARLPGRDRRPAYRNHQDLDPPRVGREGRPLRAPCEGRLRR